MMNLYYSPGACSLAPHIILQEIGQPYKATLVSTMDNSTKTDEYLEINPKGRVPVLDTREERLTEASAIMLYLALTFPKSALLPSSPIGVAQVVEWMSFLAEIHASMIAQCWRTERFSDNLSSHPEIQSKGLKNLFEAYSLIDDKLKNTTWAAGKHYSIADPYLLVFYRWGNRLGLDMQPFKHWTEHAVRIESREAVQAVLSAEEISIWE